MGWSNDFRGPESEASWAHGLRSREGGSRKRGANHSPAPPPAQEAGQGCELACPTVCHHEVIWLSVGQSFCNAYFLGSGLWRRWREKARNTGLETSGEEASLLCLSHGFLVIGFRRGGVRGQGVEKVGNSLLGSTLDFLLWLLLYITTLTPPANL